MAQAGMHTDKTSEEGTHGKRRMLHVYDIQVHTANTLPFTVLKGLCDQSHKNQYFLQARIY